ncbi:MAG: porin family protein, partial [bacterium]
MKKTVAVWVTALLVGLVMANPADAERVGGGFKAGMNIATLSGDEADAADVESVTGLIAGGYLRIELSDHFALQPELLFSRNGAKGDTLGLEGTVTLDYIEVPVLLRYSLGHAGRFTQRLFAGPSIRGRLSAEAEADNGYVRSLDTLVRPFDFGVVFGADFGILLGRPEFTLEVRYLLGLTN